MASCFVPRKVDTELGQALTSQARPRHTDHLRLSNLAARALRSVEHTPSKFSHDPCPVRRGLVAAVMCCVRKARFFRCPGRLWSRTNEARASCGFQHRRKPVLFSVFLSHYCRPKTNNSLFPLRRCVLSSTTCNRHCWNDPNESYVVHRIM